MEKGNILCKDAKPNHETEPETMKLDEDLPDQQSGGEREGWRRVCTIENPKFLHEESHLSSHRGYLSEVRY